MTRIGGFAVSIACINCGGEMIGDGYTSVDHCENADDQLYEFHEPDAGPVYCEFESDIPDNDKLNKSGT